MNKTAHQILDDVVSRLKSAGFDGVIGGRIYKKKRPDNSTAEDCVVSFKAGIDGQIQNGVVTINVYVPNIRGEDEDQGSLVENVARTRLFEATLNTICRSFTNGEYLFTPANIVETWEEEAIEQHFVHLDLDFRRITITLKN
jgi:hypothetical protein